MTTRWSTARRQTAAALLSAAAVTAGALIAAPSAAIETTDPAAPAAAEHGFFDETVLWDPDVDGHTNYHVHGIAVTPDDTILAFTEARYELSDGAPKDILVRRSTDGGETWEPSRVVVPSDGDTWGNPTAVVDEHTGDVFVVYQGPTSGDVKIVRSADSGVTWDSPVDVTDLFADNRHGWILNSMGPGHGIQLDSGRLLVQTPHRRSVNLPAPQRMYGIDVIYSDDHGETWQRGGEVPVSPEYPINESRIYQRADGAVVVNGRPAAGGHRTRISSVSHDGGLTWSNPVLEPATGRFTSVDAGMARFVGQDGTPRVLHSRPDSARRENLTVAVSYDDGYSYRYEKTVNPGSSYYSDLAVLSDGTIITLYGRDGDILAFPGRVAVARFDLAWLTDGHDDGTSGPGFTEHEIELAGGAGTRTRPPAGRPTLDMVTPDVSAFDHHAIVIGSPDVVPGAVDSAVELGTGDHLEVSRSPILNSAGHEFTAAAWFRTDQQSSQSIIWAHAMGSSTPQWWIRVEPGNNRLRALVDTGAETTGLSAPGNYADGEWHHVALTRDAETVTLYMDGQPVVEADGPVGSTSANAREGIHIGQRPDGANPLTGAVDETLLYDRALTATEIAALADPDTPVAAPGDAVLWLPMDEVRTYPDVLRRPRSIEDANARGGSYLHYDAKGPGDYVEIPFTVTDGGAAEVAVRYHRSWDRGKVQVSIDGDDLPAGLLDPSLDADEAFQTYQLGAVDLTEGEHHLRFTLIDEGRLGGTAITPDHLTLISGASQDALVRDVVVDDESSGSVAMTGTWGRATGQAGHPYYGVSYRSAPAGGGERVYQWRPDVPATGDYQVLAWWVSHPNRASNAPYTINHADGSTTVRVDQRGQARSLTDGERPGVWVDLGTYRFEAGSAGTVELSNDADGFVIADAITLTRDPVPATPADLQSAAVSSSSIEVVWSPSDGATGYHVERRAAGDGAWEFAGETSGTSLTSTALSPDTSYEHRVYAVVDVHEGRPARGSLASDPVEATTPTIEVPPDHGDIEVSTVSGRPDTVTGGDTLLELALPADATPDDLTLTVNGTDVTSDLTLGDDGATMTGLVTGLRLGDNTITATADGDTLHRTTLTVTNHPIEGPVFSGPHQQPFACETSNFSMPVFGGTLGPPLDEDCSIETRVDYFYRTTADTYRPWPAGTSSYPADMITTTTTDGVDAPFVVRMETGTVNRAIYQHTILHDPLAEPEPSFDSPPASWNGAGIFTFGAGCTNGWYRQGRNTGGVTDAFMLGQGFAVMSSSLNVFGSNCSDLTAAESAMMVKERMVEAYGPIDHTIGFGCSGGSYQAYQITDNYPGILDGIITGCSFPDVGFSTVNMITDAWLLDTYFSSTDTEWSEEEQRAVTGFATYATAPNVANGARRIDPRSFCTIVPTAQRYDPDTNPTGVRCGIYDHTINVYGPDPATGFARRPLDNVGIQYGLGALADGAISVEQFLDLNEHVGGFDRDADIRAERTVGDRDAIRIAYHTGRLTNGGGGLADVPIIDYRTYRDDNPNGELHLRYHTFSMKQRLENANGTAANYVSLLEDMRYGGFSTDSPMLRGAIVHLHDWLSTLAADSTDDLPIDKLVRTRPADLVEGCLTRDADPVFIAESLDRDRGSACEQLYPTASFPREVAGEDVAADVVKCQLKAVHPNDYTVTFTAQQWDRLETIFADGVCDYSRPGVEQQGLSDTWLRF